MQTWSRMLVVMALTFMAACAGPVIMGSSHRVSHDEVQSDNKAATGNLPSTAYFATLPPGSILPSDADCAARVRRVPREPRPDNAVANNTKGITGSWPTSLGPYSPRVSGGYTGTTDEILQWGACKWGLDEDIQRARAVTESSWHQSTLGDRTSDATACSKIGQSAPCYQSYGLLQVKGSVHTGTYPISQLSTAFNVDWSMAWQRSCFDGYFTWLGTQPESTRPYAAGDIWGCVGAWYSGNWYDSLAQSYIASVKHHLQNKTWSQPGF